VAPDHPWVSEHPEYFIHGKEDDIRRAPAEFFEANGTIIACGRDPYFPPWTDRLNSMPSTRGSVRRPSKRFAKLPTSVTVCGATWPCWLSGPYLGERGVPGQELRPGWNTG
jgi:hypothetical protein